MFATYDEGPQQGLSNEFELDESEDQVDTVVSTIGSGFTDLTNMICEQLNQDFEIANLLPYGKFISDMLGLTVGYYSFETSCRGAEAYLATCCAAPIGSLPPNPFTGQQNDKGCLLDCLSALPNEEEEIRRKDLYAEFCRTYKNCLAPKEMFLCVSSLNKQLQQLLSFIDDDLEKPAPYRLKPVFKARATRASEIPRDAGQLEQLMVMIEEGHDVSPGGKIARSLQAPATSAHASTRHQKSKDAGSLHVQWTSHAS